MALQMNDVVQATIQGEPVRLVVDDVVYPDRTCGQYEGGWWVFPEGTADDPDAPMYFLSGHNGVLWSSPGNEPVGKADLPDILDWEL